jgi:hypothetical protein
MRAASAAYLSQILPFYTTGKVPEPITLADAPTLFIYVLDLGLVVPLALLAARWLGRRSPWGYVLAGGLLVKAARMGLALLSMTWFSVRAGLEVETGFAVLWLIIAAGGTTMSVWFFRHCRS